VLWSGIGLGAVLVVWALLARRLERWRITTAMLLVPAGAAIGWATDNALANATAAHVMVPFVDALLAIILFEHAANIRGGFFGGQAKLALRMLFIAMPLGMGLAVALGSVLMPDLTLPMLLLIACVVVPIDFAPVVSFLHDERIPLRVRQLFNVEEGYSDGITAPVFLFALALASGGEHSEGDVVKEAFDEAVPHLLVALVLGIGIGAGAAWLANAADQRGLMSERSRRVLMLIAPLLTYAVNIGLHGNGFVAAFLCGIAFNSSRVYVDRAREQEFLDDTSAVLASITWFVFGAVAYYVLKDGVPIKLVVFCVLVLTVVRAVPVTITMWRSPLTRSELALLAGLGPRGTASIGLALLAYIVLPDGPADTLLSASIMVVLGSIVLHGILGPVLVSRTAVEGAAAEGSAAHRS
jgi:sodium/hydrogen antiporter